MVERQNDVVQLPSVLAINRTGGQHIQMEDVVVLGGVCMSFTLRFTLLVRKH